MTGFNSGPRARTIKERNGAESSRYLAADAPAISQNVTGSSVLSVTSHATSAVTGNIIAEAKAAIGAKTFNFIAGDQATTIATGAPAQFAVNSVFDANSNIKAAFAVDPSYFAIGEVGGEHSANGTASETSTNVIDLRGDLTKLASREDLLLGLYNGAAQGAGFTSLKLVIKADNNTISFSQIFTSCPMQWLISPITRSIWVRYRTAHKSSISTSSKALPRTVWVPVSKEVSLLEIRRLQRLRYR